MHIGDAFEEEQWKDISLEIGGIHRAAQDVCGFPQMTFQRADAERHTLLLPRILVRDPPQFTAIPLLETRCGLRVRPGTGKSLCRWFVLAPT